MSTTNKRTISPMSKKASGELETAASILWMLSELKEKWKFRYDAWAEKFRSKAELRPMREDRRFMNHVKFLREQALPVLTSKAIHLVCNDQTYCMEGKPLEDLKVQDYNWKNYSAMLHGLNRRPSLIPMPAMQLEAQLESILDIPEEIKDRIIFKNTYNWRFPHSFINIFLDTIFEETGLKVIPKGSRSPAIITPLFIINCDGAWQLLGKSNNTVFQYNLSLVEKLENTRKPAPVKVSKKERNTLKTQSEQVFGTNFFPSPEFNGQPQMVKVRYSGNAAKYAAERYNQGDRHKNDVWFERISVEEQPGEVVVKLKVNHWNELVGQLLIWPMEAEALEPPALRQYWISKIQIYQNMVFET